MLDSRPVEPTMTLNDEKKSEMLLNHGVAFADELVRSVVHRTAGPG
jgi:hypothetical protein